MRMPIVEYVADLGLDRVTPRQKAMLAVIASYYKIRYRSANLDMSALSHELLVSDGRWLRRQIEAVDKKILEHTAGRGPGAFYQFRFPEFEAQTDAEKRVNGGSKEGDKRVPSGCPEGDERVTTHTAIRKDLNLNLNQDQNRGSAPKFSQADFDERDLRKLRTELTAIYRSLEGARIVDTEHEREQEGGAHSHEGIFQRACDRAGIAVRRGMELTGTHVDAPQAKRPPGKVVNE